MTRVEQLYELQQLDSDIEAKTARVEEIEQQLVETEDLQHTRVAVADARDRKAELERKLRDIDFDAQIVRDKLKAEEKKLYGGTIRIPKELTELQKEVDHIKVQLRQIEDRELEAMDVVEQADRSLRQRQQALAALQSAWGDDQKRLAAEREELSEALRTLHAQRDSAVRRISPADLEHYEALRADKRGRAVARVERGACQACRLGLPGFDLTRLRSGQVLVHCVSCGRILYLP